MWKLVNLFIVFIIFGITTTSIAQQAPVPKIGLSCPNGWHNQGKYCVATSPRSKTIIPRSGLSCPTGWHNQGKYCVSSR